MRKTLEELEAYKRIEEDLRKKKAEIEENLWYIDIMSKGAYIGENGAFYTENIEVFNEIQDHYKNSKLDYWQDQTAWNVNTVSSQHYQNQKEFFEKNFVNHLDKKQIVCDLASADGSWSFKIADKVKMVEGFEYSKKMVDAANSKAKENEIQNVCFYHADARKINLIPDKYDNIMMMGLLTCIMNTNEARLIVRKVYDALKYGGYIITKDTLNFEQYDQIYLHNMLSNYDAIYRSKQNYYAMFEGIGFQLVGDILLEEVKVDKLQFGSMAQIWKKCEEYSDESNRTV